MGYYKCMRCGGTDTYKSEETTSYTAMTIDTPGPIDHTLVNANKREIARCRACGEKAQYIMSKSEAENQKKQAMYGAIGGAVFMVIAILLIVNFL
jgi:ribosomal protein L37E